MNEDQEARIFTSLGEISAGVRHTNEGLTRLEGRFNGHLEGHASTSHEDALRTGDQGWKIAGVCLTIASLIIAAAALYTKGGGGVTKSVYTTEHR